MVKRDIFQKIAAEIQIFSNIEQKERFIFVLGALFSRIISLKKAAEIMNMELEAFLKILDILQLEFSYLSEEDIITERNW